LTIPFEARVTGPEEAATLGRAEPDGTDDTAAGAAEGLARAVAVEEARGSGVHVSCCVAEREAGGDADGDAPAEDPDDVWRAGDAPPGTADWGDVAGDGWQAGLLLPSDASDT
jgi:hypothetical protein